MVNKEIVLSILLSVCALAAGFAWDKILGNPYWVLAILAYVVCFGLFALLNQHKYAKGIVPIASLSLFAVFFTPDKFLVYGLFAGILLLNFSIESVTKQKQAHVKILLNNILGQGLKLFLTGIILLLSFVYYGSIVHNPSLERMILPESVFNVTLKLLEAPLQGSIPGFKAEATIGELFGPQERDAFARQYSLKLSGKEKISEVLYGITLARIKLAAGDYLEYVPAIAALSYFLALKTLSTLLFFIAIMIIYIIIKLLLMMGIIQKIKIPAEQEIYS